MGAAETLREFRYVKIHILGMCLLLWNFILGVDPQLSYFDVEMIDRTLGELWEHELVFLNDALHEFIVRLGQTSLSGLKQLQCLRNLYFEHRFLLDIKKCGCWSGNHLGYPSIIAQTLALFADPCHRFLRDDFGWSYGWGRRRSRLGRAAEPPSNHA